jgi:hypothetical protein
MLTQETQQGSLPLHGEHCDPARDPHPEATGPEHGRWPPVDRQGYGLRRFLSALAGENLAALLAEM